jgi:hypothetical protein
MEKEFIPYDQALELKELGFDEPCFSVYYNGEYHEHGIQNQFLHEKNECSAPLYQQAFRWFREKYNLQVYIDFYHKDSYFYKIKSQVGKKISNTTEDIILQGTPVFPRSYKEAELECLKKLIEIINERKGT